MKKLIYILTFLPFFSCSDFLDEVSQDKIVPEKTDHFASLLLKEFNSQYPVFRQVDYMTDNMTEDPDATVVQKNNFKPVYTWQREIELSETGTSVNNNNAWQFSYEDIAIANYVIELINDADGSQEEKDYIKGEAYFIRAFSYFNLLNLYGVPYNAATANTDLGVVLRTSIGVEQVYSRNTVAECYALIEEDLTKATKLIAVSGITKSIWHPSVTACDLLMSRVKLYQEKWDEAITYATSVIDNGSLSVMATGTPFVTASNKEILYSFHTVNPLFSVFDSNGTFQTMPFRVSKAFANSFSTNDKRKSVFFEGKDDGTGVNYYLPLKYQTSRYTTLGFNNFRVAEAYLNRAEALAQNGNVTEAINDIKALQATRYTTTSGISYPTDQTAALAFILNERRKELCFEDHHRWFDLRRMKNRPEIVHTFTLIESDGSKSGVQTYTLLSNDYNYSLPIPIKERNNNPFIRNNERFEKVPVLSGDVIIN